jgi:recombination protein RecA
MANKSFDSILKTLNKDRSKNAVKYHRFSEAPKNDLAQVVSTGNYAVDFGVLKIGGLPLGRVVEIFGLESSGKSTLAKYVMREAQKVGIVPTLYDAEFSDTGKSGQDWAAKCGVDINNLIYAPIHWAEDILMGAEDAIKAGSQLIVIDSVAQMVARSLGDKDPGSGYRTQKAALLSEMMPRINALAFEHEALVIFINQIRDLPGVQYGDAFTTPGGKALKYAASIRLEVTRRFHINENNVRVGAMCRVKTYKNKTAPPGLSAEIPIYFDGRTFTQFDWIFENAVKLGIVVRANNINWEYPDEDGVVMTFKGKNAIREYFIKNDDNAALLQERVLAKGELIQTEAIGDEEEGVDIGDNVQFGETPTDENSAEEGFDLS